MLDVSPELARHEPRVALTDDGDGLSAYRIIAAEAAGYLMQNGRVAVEIGWQQKDAVVSIFKAAGWSRVDCIPDLDGRDRVVVACDPA
jgi:release factor glutamine methyltransferase